MPGWFSSIRFRLSFLYSVVMFALSALVLGGLYMGIRNYLRGQTVSTLLVRRGFALVEGTPVPLTQVTEVEARSMEYVIAERTVEILGQYTLIALGFIFVASVVIGWIMAGRALRPVGDITQVAREITATDLSQRIDLDGPDDELTRLAGTFDDMLERLEHGFESQRQFIADTSHDLRNPLTVIRANVELAIEDPDTSAEEWREAGQVVQRSAHRMGRMIDDLLSAARLQNGMQVYERVNLRDLVREVVNDGYAAAEAASVGLIAEANEAFVDGSQDALSRALANLVDNAIRVSPPGSQVVVGSDVDEEHAVLRVEDTGPGFDPAILDADRPRAGLGLKIVEQIARAHGGELLVSGSSSESDSGATFTISIPRANEARPGPGSAL